MRTSATARVAHTPPAASPITICWASCVQSKASSIGSVPEVGAADGLVAPEFGAGALDGNPADLEHVRARGGVEGEGRVLLDDEHREPFALVQLAHDPEDLADDHRRQAERRLVE